MIMSTEHRYFALLTYGKRGLLRYLGHLDIVRAFDRAVRRARLPVKYSEGFAPRAQLSFPPPLPVGAEGLQEMCALDLTVDLDAQKLHQTLAPQLRPFGLSQVQVHRDMCGSIWSQLYASDYRALPNFADRADALAIRSAIKTFADADEVTVERHTKRRTRAVNIRPHVYELGLVGDMVTMRVGATEETMVKPAEVLAALGEYLGFSGGTWHRLIRTAMHFRSAEIDLTL